MPTAIQQPGLTRQPVNTNPSPKARFRESTQNITAHRDMLQSPEFERALDFAALEYQLQAAARVTDGNGALALGYKLLGVQEFISTLKMLSEVPQPMPRTIDQNLDHKV